MRSVLLDDSFWSDFCNSVFPYFDLLTPEIPRTLSYLGSRIIYTNGVEDPWQWASYQGSSLPNQQLYALLIDCPDCSHCVDLTTPTSSDPQQLLDARQFILTTIQSWLSS